MPRPRSAWPRAHRRRQWPARPGWSRPRDAGDHAGHLDNDLFEYDDEFADFDSSGCGAKPVQQPHPTIFFSGLKDARRSASRIAKYGLSGWIGIQDSPEDISRWRGEIQRKLADPDMLRRYKEAGLTMPLLWPPFQDVPVAKTLDDHQRLTEEIMPKVEAS